MAKIAKADMDRQLEWSGNATAEELPEDRAARLEAIEYGRQKAEAFKVKFADKMTALISTYPDATAERLLAELRERFWMRDW